MEKHYIPKDKATQATSGKIQFNEDDPNHQGQGHHQEDGGGP